ncbi:unnamed protein product, partial [Porites lobata]
QGRAIFVSETSPIPAVWISHQNASGHRQITLYSSSKSNILSSTGWLTDSEVEAAQDLLKSQFPLVDGLEDPSIVGDLVTPVASAFVQIINTGSHWVCLNVISFEIRNQKVQKRKGYNDCALFAIAFATTLCHGGDPTTKR